MAGIKANIHRIADDLWAIDEIGNDIMYLIDGVRRALLIDTGYGMVDLKALAGQLCPGRELMVVNSHIHPDHASGNAQFGQVFCGRYDEPRAHSEVDGAAKLHMMSHLNNDRARAAGLDADAWQPGPARRVTPLADGDVIDLGDTQLTVVETPGHTLGSIALHDAAHSRLFTGDMALTWPVWGHLADSSALSVYQKSLAHMAALNAQSVHPAHGDPGNAFGCPIWLLPPRTLEVFARETRDIVEGRRVGEPYHSFAGDGLCVEFEIGGMAYDPARIG